MSLRRAAAVPPPAESSPPPQVFPELLRVREAAKVLNLSTNAVYDLVRARKIEVYRLSELGDGVRISRAALLAYLESRRVPAELPTGQGVTITAGELLKAAQRRQRIPTGTPVEFKHLRSLPAALKPYAAKSEQGRNGVK